MFLFFFNYSFLIPETITFVSLVGDSNLLVVVSRLEEEVLIFPPTLTAFVGTVPTSSHGQFIMLPALFASPNSLSET